MKKSQNTKAIDAWQAQNVDKILLKPRKYKHLPERIKLALDRNLSDSRQSYIIEAIETRLNSDGIPETVDDGN